MSTAWNGRTSMTCERLNRMARRIGPLFLVVWMLGAGWARAADPAPAETTRVRTIMAGDRLRIMVLEAAEMSRVYAVAGDGTVDMELIGRVSVEGMDTETAARTIEDKLQKSYFKKATVTVDVSEFVEGSILILGAVNSPGAIPFKGDTLLTLVEAISMCGGLLPTAAGNEVRIVRWKPGGGMERQILTVDFKTMLDNLDFARDQFLRPRDIIFVPSLGEGQGAGEFLALGEFASPGFHLHVEGMDMIRAVARAGGVSREGKMDSARILRPDSKGQYRVIPVDLQRLFGAADMQMNVPVQAGDILFVPSAQQSAGGKIYLLGEVASPGIMGLPMDRESTLARTLLTAGGLSKFANGSKVRIQRTAPDGTRQTLLVDVERILKTGAFEDDVPLKDEDVIIVPERVLF